MKTLLAVLTIGASLSLASAQSYVAIMDGAQDSGGARMGMGTVDLTLSGTTLSLSGSYSGLTTDMTDAHIHGPSLPGVNVGILYHLFSTGIATGTTSGTISGDVNLVPLMAGAYTVAEQIDDLNNNLWYINIHNTTFSGGEIRGQIVLVPEPSALALLALAAASLAAWRRARPF